MQADSSIHERIARIETSLGAAADTLKAISTRMEIIGDLALSLARTQERVDIQAEELADVSGRLADTEAESPLIRERFSNWVSVNKGVVAAALAAATVFSWFVLRMVSDYDSQLSAFREQYTTIDRRIAWVEYSIYKDPKNQNRREAPSR
jgi:hypothetical protein